MGKRKRKLIAAEKAEKKRRRLEYMTIFINGKQKRVKRPPTIDGLPVDEFIRRNPDPTWLHQHGMHEELSQLELEQQESQPEPTYDSEKDGPLDDDLPFKRVGSPLGRTNKAW